MDRPRLDTERPRCPRGHDGDVLLAGRRVWKGGVFQRSRFICVPQQGERHKFSLPRRQPTGRHPHGDTCPSCDARGGRSGGPITAVDHRFSAAEIAALLIRLGRGASLREASQVARFDAQRHTVDAFGGRRASRQADLASDYLHAFVVSFLVTFGLAKAITNLFAGDLPALRMVVVAGPRLETRGLSQSDGVEVRGYVPGLHRHLAASDVAVVHGGQATTMELLAARRPFAWFPLKRDFEQRCHVTHRLRRYRAGRPTEYAATSAEALADAIVDRIGGEVHFRPVAGGCAARAASLLATLL